jgi:hypothetical protein
VNQHVFLRVYQNRSSSFIFPLPYLCIPNISHIASPRGRSRAAFRRAFIHRFNAAVHALNRLWADKTESGEMPPRHPTADQLHAMAIIMSKCRRMTKFLAHARASLRAGQELELEKWSGNPEDDLPINPEVEEELQEREVGRPTSSLLTGWQHIQVDRLSLPSTGEGASVELLPLLPEDTRLAYTSGVHVLRDPEPSDQELDAVKLIKGIASADYPKLIATLSRVGMVKVQQSAPKVVNGLFATPKDKDKQRLIIDARRGNMFFKDPEKVDLPTPAILADLVVKSDHIFIGKTDVRNMYHRFKTPEWMWQYFGLPEVTLEDGSRGWPVVVSLPMGFSHAVFLAHTAHLTLAKSVPASLAEKLLIGPGPHVIGDGVLEYIDDEVVISGSQDRARAHHANKVDELAKVGLEDHEGKRVVPGDQEQVDCIGTTLSMDAFLRPAQNRLAKVELLTLDVIHRQHASPKALSRLIGAWIWILLIFRPALSIIGKSIYEFIRSESTKVVPVPPEVLTELSHLVGIVPFLLVDLKMEFAPMALATDASFVGAGACVAHITEEQAHVLMAARQSKGWYQLMHEDRHMPVQETVNDLVAQLQWNVIHQRRWGKQGDIICRLEAHALISGLKCLIAQREIWGTRLPILIDSTAVLGAMAKGRSSTDVLNHLCRRVASLFMVLDVRPVWLWIPSEGNPADKPSRQ